MPYVNIKVTGGSEAPTVEQKNEIMREVTQLLGRILNKNPATTVVIINEVEMDNWGVGGESATIRRQKAKSQRAGAA